MARIVPKLNLNKIPELVDNHSLIFAKNIRFNSNGISSDFGFDKVSVEHLSHGELDWLEPNEEIVGIIPYNTSFYLFVNNPGTGSYICRYDEVTHSYEQVQCNWNWSGGKIDGIVTVNLNSDIILTIAEYDTPDGKLVPLKVINLTEAKDTDDESIYTQAPKVPFINLNCYETYNNIIPAGTYQFFVRYEIRKDFYTHWFPASKELFSGCRKTLRTQQGGLRYIDTSVDSDFSFVLDVEKPISVNGFKSFQLGFIIAHDDEVYARAYKHYSFDTSRIYFDYDTEYIEEIDVRDILESPFLLYNVKNVTSFKNKLYVSNYKESDVNPDLEYFAQSIDIELAERQNESKSLFEGRNITIDTVAGQSYIQAITLNELDEHITDSDTVTIPEIISNTLNKYKDWILNIGDDHRDYIQSNQYGIKTHLTKVITKVDITDPENPIINPSHGEDPDDHYVPSIVDGDDPGEDIPWEDSKPTIGHYEIVKQPAGTKTDSANIDDILSFVSSNVTRISVDSGNFTDGVSTSNVTFRLTYYITGTDVGDTNYYMVFIAISFSINKDAITLNYSLKGQYTLVPNQGYYFYVHLVKDTGESTNGYLINNINATSKVPEPVMIPEPSAMIGLNDFPAIYPKFTFNTNLPEGYVACFISIAHVKNKVAHVFDISTVNNTVTIGSCLELDIQAYTWLNNIPVINGGNKVLMDYRASYDSDYLLTFGGAGSCVFSGQVPEGMTYGFICMPYEAKPEYISSIRCTPFIKYNATDNPYVYDNYDALNLPGYLCRVKKPLKDKNFNRYFSGSDIYNKSNSLDGQGNFVISLTNMGDTEADWGTLYDSEEFTVYSNFNLNFISLSDKITPRIVSKTVDNNDNSHITYSHLLLCRDSSILSDIYNLSSMYKSYTRKLYYPYDTYNKLVIFDNTIRSSVLEGDESKINMFRFNSTDYYNVPTDKGIIINLVAVGDNILVHTQDSIYKFSGQNSLTAAGGEDVQMKESEVFDTGIQELFGSEYGYAGLASKDHQILSEFGYTFWDKDSGRIYLYTGNAQMKVLSDDITKLLRRDTISNTYLADDYYNNRIFICIIFSDGKVATLSYDFVAKSFISVHDFAFEWHFKTKTKCYFISNRHDVYKVGTEEGSYGPFVITNYGVYPKHETEDCIVDVIFNDRFEGIKVLNTIEWICNKIVGFDSDFNMAEETFAVIPPENRYKGDYLTLYSDSCRTEQFDIATRSNDTRLKDNLAPFNIKPKVDSYKQVRYNLGKWTFNYFRNILNRGENPVSGRTLGRDDTLIYGKYFVARFVFSRNINFKFEDVTFNVTDEYNA